jgi:hypothetical protein
MTNDEINVAIAEHLGWREVAVYEWERGVRLPKQYVEACDLPNYCTCLNAMNEAEKIFDSMPVDDRSLWYDYLGLTVRWNGAKNQPDARFECSYLSARATARQRAGAFLKTVGKWKE